MNLKYSTETAWAIEQLGTHINYTGWSLAIACGLSMWLAMIGAAI